MTFGTRPRRSSRPWQDAQQTLSEKDQRRRTWAWTGREPGPSRVLSGCDAATPTAPELRRPSVLNYLLGTAFRAEDPPARPFFFLSAAGALLWLALAVGKRARPGKALQHLQGTVFSAEALSRPARSASFLPFCCRHTPFGWCSLLNFISLS